MYDGFKTNRERKFYKFLGVFCWCLGAVVVAVGVWLYFWLGDKGAWKIIAAGALLPFLHNFYFWCGVNIGWSMAALYDMFRRRP